jgi:hypothetical protein
VPDYTIYTEDVEGELHIHCDVKRWAPSVLKMLYIELSFLKDWASIHGYEEMFSISPNPKFCELFCAESLGTYGNYEVMRWDLN